MNSVYAPQVSRMTRYSKLIKNIAEVFSLSKTDTEIMNALSSRERSFVSEIAESVRRSDRGIRGRLNLLVEKGLIKKEIGVTKNKRLAHIYSLESVKNILGRAKKLLLKKIDEIENLA
jgi:predicted transcriptional regulator